MITDLESVLVQLPDLLPSHVIVLVSAKVKPFGNEERGAKAMLLENGPHDREM